jgi:D-tagatose 6-phosphate 4-epimerase
MEHPLLDIPASFHKGRPKGITSVCSAHPLVIEAALRLAQDLDRPALIEATCNQVNQDGGYTGMTPADFRRFVEGIATRIGFDPARVILGGDHLGPNPWKSLPADQAMAKADRMIADFAAAGFTKLHLDTSMGCQGEPVALPDQTTAERAARLAATAEAHVSGPLAPVYVIGTEVPVPGGALEELDHLQITTPEAVAETHKVHRDAFAALDLGDAFSRVIALVVQPGVEFGDDEVVQFDPGKAEALSGVLQDFPGVVFEAHSTDYQAAKGLSALVQHGFAILKVGPWLTFALREALYGLDAAADALDGNAPQGRLMAEMDRIMEASPGNWKNYYSGAGRELWLKRHFSYSDRIRYYWPNEEAAAAVEALLARLDGRTISEPVFKQYLACTGAGSRTARPILLEAVQSVLRAYENAVA